MMMETLILPKLRYLSRQMQTVGYLFRSLEIQRLWVWSVQVVQYYEAACRGEYLYLRTGDPAGQSASETNLAEALRYDDTLISYLKDLLERYDLSN
jgi:hypothetical protein